MTLKKLAAVAAIFAVGFFTGSAHQRDQFINAHLVVEEYTVKAGDTFWNIAQRYANLDERHMYILEYHDEIYANNPELVKRNGQVYPGDVISIRYYKE